MDNKIEYEFLDLPESDPTQNSAIKIKTGQYKDIVFRFGKISLQEINDNLNVHMEIDVVSAPHDFNKEHQEFTNTVGEIFTLIVENGIEAKKVEPVDLEDDVHVD